MTPALKASRGTKRKCQNDACALPFYDLNRTVIACPNCATGFVPPPIDAPRTQGRYGRPFSRSPVRLAPVLEAAPIDEPTAEPAAAEADGGEAILEVDLDEEEPLALDVGEEPDKQE